MTESSRLEYQSFNNTSFSKLRCNLTLLDLYAKISKSSGESAISDNLPVEFFQTPAENQTIKH